MNNQNEELFEHDVPTELPVLPRANQPVNLMQSNMATDLESAVQNAEKFVALQDNIRKMAVRVTNVNDWVDEGGNPYLQEKGAEKIAMAFGVSISNTNLEKEEAKDDKGQYITYIYSGTGSWQGRSVPQIGTCSSRDPFFGKKGGQLLPLSEVKLVDVRKKAYTNMLNRVIKRNQVGHPYLPLVFACFHFFQLEVFMFTIEPNRE